MMKRNGSKAVAERLSLGRAKEEAIIPAAGFKRDLPPGYAVALTEIKQRVRQARLRTVLSANSAMILLYWDIGRLILARQGKEGWGARVIDRLAVDLGRAFPKMRGFSPRNLKYMRAFATAWPDGSIVQRHVAQLTWGVNITLLERLEKQASRLWYAERVLSNGWSRDILAIQIEGQAHERHGKAVSNFKTALPPADSDMATQVFKDPYLFDFLGTSDTRRESEVEDALVGHVQKFLLELGTGFAFVGRQVLLEVGGEDYRVDLLFYHLKLRRYVVIELKAVPFQPAFVGQINLYLSAVDDLLRHPDDKPAIGLLLCRSKNRLVAEYALRGLQKPIGVAQWGTKIVKALPVELKSELPSIKELESELGDPGKEG